MEPETFDVEIPDHDDHLTLPGSDNRLRYGVSIDGVQNGYIVRVGCKAFAFVDLDHLLTLLRQYLTDPNTTIKQWESGKLTV